MGEVKQDNLRDLINGAICSLGEVSLKCDFIRDLVSYVIDEISLDCNKIYKQETLSIFLCIALDINNKNKEKPDELINILLSTQENKSRSRC